MLERPHEAPPTFVTVEPAEPLHVHAPAGSYARVDVRALLAEPTFWFVPHTAMERGPGSTAGEWFSRCYSRLLVASAGPLIVAPLEAWGGRREGTYAEHVAAGPATVPWLWRLRFARWAILGTEAPPVDPEALRRERWPTYAVAREAGIGVGCLAPQLVVVGERAPRAEPPFAARSGVWLLRALRELGYDECELYLTNALAPNGRPQRDALLALHDAFAPLSPRWLALGETAALELKHLDIPHAAAPHPAWHRRFRYAEGPIGLAAHLIRAGIPRGEWYAHHRLCPGYPARELGKAAEQAWHAEQPPELPIVKVAEAKDLEPLPDVFVAPKHVSFMKTLRTHGTSVPRLQAEQARRAYVTGAVATVVAAARLVGVGPTHLAERARVEEWDAERTEYLRHEREALYHYTQAREAEQATAARMAAWDATVLALTSVRDRLREGRLVANPLQAATLARTALALSGVRDGQTGDPAMQELAALPGPELCGRLVRVIEEQFGAGVVPGRAVVSAPASGPGNGNGGGGGKPHEN